MGASDRKVNSLKRQDLLFIYQLLNSKNWLLIRSPVQHEMVGNASPFYTKTWKCALIYIFLIQIQAISKMELSVFRKTKKKKDMKIHKTSLCKPFNLEIRRTLKLNKCMVAVNSYSNILFIFHVSATQYILHWGLVKIKNNTSWNLFVVKFKISLLQLGTVKNIIKKETTV